MPPTANRQVRPPCAPAPLPFADATRGQAPGPVCVVPVAGVVRALVVTAAALVAAAWIGYLLAYGFPDRSVPGGWRYFRMFDLEGEANAPAWFSSALLLACAALLAVLAAAGRRRRGDGLAWTGLALGFAAMSLDEAAMVHEQLIEPLRNAFGFGGLLWHAWVPVGAAVALAAGIAYARFLWRLPRRTALRFAVAGAVFLSGALALEMVGGAFIEAEGRRNLAYAAVMTLEEVAEMAGVILFLRALLLHLRDEVGPVTLRWGRGPAPRRPLP